MEGNNIGMWTKGLVNGDLHREAGLVILEGTTGLEREKCTSDICAASSCSSRLALDRHLMAYSRPYTMSWGVDGLVSRSIVPIVDM